MKPTTKFLVAAAIGFVALSAGGYLFLEAYLRAVVAGKTVRKGTATIVELRNLGCEEAKRDALSEAYRNWRCSPDERVLRAYLRVDEFRSLNPRDNARLLRAERQNEVKGVWRCEDHHFYFDDVPDKKVGEKEAFQFQFFPSLGVQVGLR